MLQTCNSCGTVFDIDETILSKKIQWLRCSICNEKWSVSSTFLKKFDQYKIIGTAKLEARAKLIRENKEFAEKIESIKRSEVQEKEQSKSQEDLYNEESIYAKFTTAEDNKIMSEFHLADWDKKLHVVSRFKDERPQYFGQKLLYIEIYVKQV